MRGHVTNEMDVGGASADEIWAVYGSKDLPMLIITLQPGIPGLHEWREKIATIYNRRRVKQLQQIQNGYLDLGFSLTTIRSTVQIDLDDKNFEANARLITIDSMWVWRNQLSNTPSFPIRMISTIDPPSRNFIRVKQLQQIQNGYLDLGFSLTTIRSTVQIDLDDKNFEANARLITIDSMWGMAKSIVKYSLRSNLDDVLEVFTQIKKWRDFPQKKKKKRRDMKKNLSMP
ncbi:hypothetical protein MKW92_026225 [Papaver armeniacum]|nr:hypothetical protein MKW92_026225 [Papaver armeniacum]